MAAALALAALSLLAPYALAFDPWAWVVWGREAGRLALDTSSGPSWKPFPVIFTTPFALFGDAAPALWLIVARAGGLLALAGAYALAARLAGRWAGVASAAVMALSPWWAFNTALGNSEGLLAAAVLWAVVAHLGSHHRAALALLTAAALMRPEVWPFLGAYGWWLRREQRAFVIASGAVVLAFWLGPDLVGAGGALDASKTGRGVPSPGSAKLADVPVLALLWDTATLFTIPAVIAAVFAAGRIPRRIAAGAAAWVGIVAVMTVAGFAGNPRYLVAAASLGAVLAGVGAVQAATALAARGRTRAVAAGGAEAARLDKAAAPTGPAAAPRSAAAPSAPAATPSGPAAAPGGSAAAPGDSAARLGPAAAPRHAAARIERALAAPSRAPRLAAPLGAAVLVAAVLAVTAGDLRDQADELASRADASAAFEGVLAAAGGKRALLDCSRVRTSNRARSLVAFKLDLPLRDLDATPERPAVVIRAKWFYGQGLEPPIGPGYRTLVSEPYWQIVAACGPAPQLNAD